MYVKNLRMYEVRKLKELPLESGVLNTEALMLVLNRRYFSDRKERVFKYLDAQDDTEIMSKKYFVVSTLNKIDEYQSMHELILPDSLIYVDGNLSGFAMPLIEHHRNLGMIINNPCISLKEKLFYLEQLGQIISKVEKVENPEYRLYFGDLNEFNFIIDAHNQVRAVDMDSSYLGVGEPFDTAYYLLKNPYILSIPDKYKTTANGIVIPSNNTDLYCYNMILLNALSKNDIYKCEIDDYYRYMEYLCSLGLPDELLESFYNIYIPKDNINPKDSLKNVDFSLEKKLEFKFFKKEIL